MTVKSFDPNPTTPTICLGMIVKDEAHVIERCLDSVRDSIDCLFIDDTGSTDQTVAVVSDWVHRNKVRGSIDRNVPWFNFGYNRSKVLRYIRLNEDMKQFNYTFMLDADETLQGDLKQALEQSYGRYGTYFDTYQIEVQLGDITYTRNFLFSNSKPFYFAGVIHEYAECDEPFNMSVLDGVRIISHHDGARSLDPDKYQKDVKLFEQMAPDRDLTPREAFYFAQSLRDAGDIEKAIFWYNARTNMEGYEEEEFYSHFMLGKLQDDGAHSYLTAFDMSPDRMEPLFWFGKDLMDKGMFHAASIVLAPLEPDMELPPGLFVETDVYVWRGAMERAVAAHYCKQYALAVGLNQDLLDRNQLPPDARVQVETNIAFSRQAYNND